MFSYTAWLSDDGLELEVSPSPSVAAAEVEAAVTEALAHYLTGPKLVVAEPGIELGQRVVDRRKRAEDSLVRVIGLGSTLEQQRAAWRLLLARSQVDGAGEMEILEHGSGAPVTEPVIVEAYEQLRRLLDQISVGLVSRRRPSVVVIGLPEAGEVRAGDWWIVELEADDSREGMLVAGSNWAAVERVVALFDTGQISPELAQYTLNGIHMQPYSRPSLAFARVGDDGASLVVDAERCNGAGDCARICPTRAIAVVEGAPVIAEAACIRCHLCVERCEQVALRVVSDGDAFVDGEALVRDIERVARVRDRARPRALEGKLVEPPAALDPRRAPATIRRKPTVVLGLATVTLMEHAAALLIDGELVAGIEEERLARVRHYSFSYPPKPGASLSSETCMRVEDAWPQRSIDAVLKTAGLSFDDVDLVAVNGIPARFNHSFRRTCGWRPPPVLRANSVAFVPHHMTHAASAYGLSGFDDAWILSIDGRGDYETATVWRAEGHELAIVDAVPWLPDRSFGGVYETATRVLGFGSHGQGSTMALAALGEPVIDVSDCLGIDADGVPVLSEWNADKRFAPYQRGYDDPLTDEHKNLAASVQTALETTVAAYLRRHAGDLRGQNLGICGGVALNCRMNGTLRAEFAPAQMHVPPGANDAGTAIGAAIIGHRELTGELPRLDLGHTHVGPAWSDEAIARSLERMRVPFQRLRDVGAETAELLAAGKIVCWFQGPMEFGPRALGGRSILADPRREDLKERLNAMKSRQSWRPFGSSVLAGRQGEWFTHDWDSRFMLFAVDVRPDKRAAIPVVVHFDGSTRPQVVHRDQHPRYWALIDAFDRRTGVPMIVNTSFNRGGEPIVCNPAEAMRSFAGLGADAIVLGNCLVRRELVRRR